MAQYHLAHVNIGRIKGPIDGPVMAGFMARLDEVNAVAESSPGFVWRLKTESNNATYFRPYPEDDTVLINMSVWESVEALQNYVYKSAHRELLKQRKDWFEQFTGVYLALWWVPVGHNPSIDEAKKRIAHLEAHGPSQFAFTFKNVFVPDEEFQTSIDWGSFRPCPSLG